MSRVCRAGDVVHLVHCGSSCGPVYVWSVALPTWTCGTCHKPAADCAVGPPIPLGPGGSHPAPAAETAS